MTTADGITSRIASIIVVVVDDGRTRQASVD
jgi:hypothetical protein